jgi:hypothetical protein
MLTMKQANGVYYMKINLVEENPPSSLYVSITTA